MSQVLALTGSMIHAIFYRFFKALDRFKPRESIDSACLGPGGHANQARSSYWFECHAAASHELLEIAVQNISARDCTQHICGPILSSDQPAIWESSFTVGFSSVRNHSTSNPSSKCNFSCPSYSHWLPSHNILSGPTSLSKASWVVTGCVVC